MTKSFNKFKKPYFGSIFPHFGAKKNFPESLSLSRTTSYGFLAPCQNSEKKTNNTITRKCPDRQKDRQALFHRILPGVNKDFNGESSCLSKLPFSASQKVMFTKLLLNKEVDNAGNCWQGST